MKYRVLVSYQDWINDQNSQKILSFGCIFKKQFVLLQRIKKMSLRKSVLFFSHFYFLIFPL